LLSLALVGPALLLPLLQSALAKAILQLSQLAWEMLVLHLLLLAHCALVCWSSLVLALQLRGQLLAL
jgi:hypothetical protein